MHTLPFTYLIGWSNLNKWYYGVRYARGCQPTDLWTKYWTSSKTVKNYRSMYGEPDVLQIRRTFKTKAEAIHWEDRVLKRLNSLDPFACVESKWLNSTISGSILLNEQQMRAKTMKTLDTRSQRTYTNWNTGLTKETSASVKKISDSHKGKPKTEDHKKKIGDSNRGRKKSDTSRMGKYERTPEIINKMMKSRQGYVTSKETKIKISNTLKGRRKGIPGKPASDDTRKRMSDVRKGVPSHKKGKKTYTDGTQRKMFFENQQPEGWFIHKRTEF